MERRVEECSAALFHIEQAVPRVSGGIKLINYSVAFHKE
jgi:hypothetical protein